MKLNSLFLTLLVSGTLLSLPTLSLAQNNPDPNEGYIDENFENDGVGSRRVDSNTIIGAVKNPNKYNFSFTLTRGSNGIWVLSNKSFSDITPMGNEFLKLQNVSYGSSGSYFQMQISYTRNMKNPGNNGSLPGSTPTTGGTTIGYENDTIIINLETNKVEVTW